MTKKRSRGVVRASAFWCGICVGALGWAGAGTDKGEGGGGKPEAPPAGEVSAAATARVTVVKDPGATTLFEPNIGVVREMVRTGVLRAARRRSEAEAWRVWIGTNDVVGIKVLSTPGATSGTRPAVVEGVVRSLLDAGIGSSNIVIWDKQPHDLQAAGYYALAARLGVRCEAAAEAGWDETKFYEKSLLGRPLFGELEFGRKGDGVGRRSHVTKLLTQTVTKLVSVAPVLNHNLAAVNGHLTSLGFGSLDNTLRFETQVERISDTLPELVALPEIYDRLVLVIGDALICQYRGEERLLLHYAVSLNELRFSTDPVAMDVLSWGDIERWRRTNPADGEKPVKTELFNNAAILDLGVAQTNRIQVHGVDSP